MPKTKWVIILLACLLLAGGAFYWQKESAQAPPEIGRSPLTQAADTTALKTLTNSGIDPATEETAGETKKEKRELVSETVLEQETVMDPESEESTQAEEWIFATEALMVNINTADGTELQKLPGIGPSKAQAIIAYRQEHGPFRSIEELMLVPGIKEGTFSKLKDYVTV